MESEAGQDIEGALRGREVQKYFGEIIGRKRKKSGRLRREDILKAQSVLEDLLVADVLCFGERVKESHGCPKRMCSVCGQFNLYIACDFEWKHCWNNIYWDRSGMQHYALKKMRLLEEVKRL